MATQMILKNDEKAEELNSLPEPDKPEISSKPKPFNFIGLNTKIAKTYKLIEYTNNYKEFEAMWNKWKRLLELKSKYK